MDLDHLYRLKVDGEQTSLLHSVECRPSAEPDDESVPSPDKDKDKDKGKGKENYKPK